MKIIHIASEYPPQKVFGLGRYVHDLAVEQSRQGDEVHVITNSTGGRDHEKVDQGVHVHRVDFPPPPKPADSGATVAQFNTQLIERAIRDRIAKDADVVNAHDWLTAPAGNVAARQTNSRLVLTIHDLIVGKRLGNMTNDDRYVGNVEHWACRSADQVICVSQHTRQELIENYGASPSKIAVIHNAVSPKRFLRPDAKLLQRFRRVLANDQEEIVLFVGRLDAEKGVEVLLEAFRELVQTQPGVRLVLAGSGALGGEIGQRIQQMGLADRVRLLGYVQGEALRYLYHCASVLSVPSRYEPFGIVALEGMASGVPVVASATGGLKEIITDGENGLLFPSGDPGQLRHRLQVALSQPILRESLSKMAHACVHERFNWTHVAKATRAVYEGPVPSHGPCLPISRTNYPKNPRVLFDCTAIHPGMTGIGLFTQAILERLPALLPNMEWLLLATPRNSAYLGERFPFRQIHGNGQLELRYPTRQRALGKLVTQVQGNLYFGPMFDAPQGCEVPSITAIHDLAFLHFPDMLAPELTDYTVQASAHAARTATVILTGSEAIRHEIVEHYGIPKERIVVTHYGVDDCLGKLPDMDERRSALRRLGIEKPFILALNLTNVRKNARRLFEAYGRLATEGEKAPALVVAGGWDLSRANLWRTAYDAGIDNRIVITGYIPRHELLCLYAEALAVCMPSLYEGFGIPIAEAMACGVPVLTSDCGAMREVVEDAGVLVNPEDISSIHAGLERIMSDNALRDRCIVQGKKRAGKFTWNESAKQVASAFRRALEGNKCESSLTPSN